MNVALRPADIFELPAAETMGEYADWTLEHGEYLIVDGFLLLPDLLLLAEEANGNPLPETIICSREDGRSVHVYVVVDGQGYGLRPTP